mmetsp:Transcript_41862/g.82056  ORF Transcript_41862/g.82056 Transcript_41862/m.82056 type:complete len:233 (+) Transcript_41862:495-1193(+)
MELNVCGVVTVFVSGVLAFPPGSHDGPDTVSESGITCRCDDTLRRLRLRLFRPLLFRSVPPEPADDPRANRPINLLEDSLRGPHAVDGLERGGSAVPRISQKFIFPGDPLGLRQWTCVSSIRVSGRIATASAAAAAARHQRSDRKHPVEYSVFNFRGYALSRRDLESGGRCVVDRCGTDTRSGGGPHSDRNSSKSGDPVAQLSGGGLRREENIGIDFFTFSACLAPSITRAA